MALNEGTQRTMDEAAEEAGEELQKHLSEWSAEDICTWVRKWYGKAGYKRLGRLLKTEGQTYAR